MVLYIMVAMGGLLQVQVQVWPIDHTEHTEYHSLSLMDMYQSILEWSATSESVIISGVSIPITCMTEMI